MALFSTIKARVAGFVSGINAKLKTLRKPLQAAATETPLGPPLAGGRDAAGDSPSLSAAKSPEAPILIGAKGGDEPADSFPPITRKNFYKHPIFWARFLGYAIPLSFLLYVLYLNYLPFGYHKTFTINVGSANDTKVSEFYLEPSADLSDRMTAADGTTYRELNGMATAVFKPNAVLKNAEITVEVKGGDGISLIPPQIDFDPNSVKWDYDWDFTKGVPEGLINNNSKKAFPFEGGTYFDGGGRVEMASSSDKFEDGPFTVYAEWMPMDNTSNLQEIVGHFNWELLQNKDMIRFQIGRMNTATGTFIAIKYPISEDFFNKKHSLLATYSPTKNGSIKLFIDNSLAGNLNIGNEKIWRGYGQSIDLKFGDKWGTNTNSFKGFLYKISFVQKDIFLNNKSVLAKTDDNNEIRLSIMSNEPTNVAKITCLTKE